MLIRSIYIGVLLALLSACGEEEKNTAMFNENGAPISPKNKVDLRDGFCYQLHTHYLSEAIAIADKNGRLEGKGEGMIFTDERFYNIELNGSCLSGLCKVEVKRTFRDGQPANIVTQTWRKGNWAWAVEDSFAMLDMPKEALTYRRIRCADKPDDDYKFDAILGFSDGVGLMRVQGRFGLIDTAYNILVPPIYATMGYIHDSTIVFVDTSQQNNGRMGIMDITGKEIIPPIYISATPFYDGLAAVLPYNGKGYGFIDRTGKMVIPAKYKQIQSSFESPLSKPFSEGLAPVALDQKWGYIDKKGNVAIPFEYEMATAFNNGVAQVVLNGKMIEIDLTGKCLKNCD
jgi:hypothetical protein